MATIQAFIRTTKKVDKKGREQKNVFVRFRLKEGRSIDIFHKSEIAVSAGTWDAKEQCINKRILYKESERQRINDAIRDRKHLILDLFEKVTDKEGLTSAWLETEIDKKIHPEKYAPETIDTLFKFIDKFIADAPNRKNKAGRVIGNSTRSQYSRVMSVLKSFCLHIGKNDFLFNEIDQVFWERLVSFLQTEIAKTDKNGNIRYKKDGEPLIRCSYKVNSINEIFRVLRTMLNEATKQKYNVYTDYKNFRAPTEATDSIYLNENELQQIKDVDLSISKSLDRDRDFFLLLAWTGSRYSDLDKIGTSDIKDGFISFRQQKTNNKVTIPLHPVVLEMLEKYNYDLPKVLDKRLFNRSIKEIAKRAGIDTPETITFTRGGKLVTEKHPKYELVSSHTGRRSFATNMYKRGLPTLMIMSITGHTTETSFLKYIKVRQSEHAEMMKKAWENIYK
jgi:integrase